MKAIHTKYLGQTNTKPARIKAYTDEQSIIVICDMHYGAEENHTEAALQLINKMKWKPNLLAVGHNRQGNTYVMLDGLGSRLPMCANSGVNLIRLT